LELVQEKIRIIKQLASTQSTTSKNLVSLINGYTDKVQGGKPEQLIKIKSEISKIEKRVKEKYLGFGVE
jgi:hypothetical protein